jgi:hypothetical protein
MRVGELKGATRFQATGDTMTAKEPRELHA